MSVGETEALLRARELLLLQSEVRRDPDAVARLLCAEFFEIGASGRTYDREQVIAALANSPLQTYSMHDFACRCLDDDLALVSYRASRLDADAGEAVVSVRSSLWRRCEDGWRMCFHQGTRIVPA